MNLLNECDFDTFLNTFFYIQSSDRSMCQTTALQKKTVILKLKLKETKIRNLKSIAPSVDHHGQLISHMTVTFSEVKPLRMATNI